MNIRATLTFIFLTFLCLINPDGRVFAQQTADSSKMWTPEMQMKVKNFGSLSVSPDGKRVAYTVIEAIMTADKSEQTTQIYLADADGSDSRQITFGEKSSSNPKWSPDGKTLAFLSNRRDNRNGIYLLRLDGGEAEPLTETKTGVADFEWSPDSASIAFTASEPKTADEEKADRARSDFRWIDENFRMSHLYVISVPESAGAEKREPQKITSGDFNVNTDFDWSPDGGKIAFTHSRSPKLDDWKSSDVSVVEIGTKKITPLAASPTAESSPLFSPDGKRIALLIHDDPPRWASSESIYIIPASGEGTPQKLADTPDNQPTLLGWSPDGKRLFFTEQKGTATSIYSINTESNKITEINKSSDEVYQNVTLNRTSAMFGFVRQKSDAAAEAFVSGTENFAPVQVSRANADLPRLPLGKTELVRWKSNDGREIEGLLTYPVGYQKGQRVPLILCIHGGPAQAWQQTFTAARFVYPYASFAARGYAVLRPNPRGSSAYGAKFRRANIKNWGIGDYQDLMTGVDAVIKMGVADENRLGVMGWSYGGFMTAWILTQTKRFKTASAGAPVTNLVSFTGTTDMTTLIPDYFESQPWENMDIYRKHSVMFNVKGVSTPTLIQHGEADFRVPISQSYEFFHALKQQGVPVRMMVLPRQPHGPNEPKMLLAVMESNLEWFDKYLGNISGQR